MFIRAVALLNYESFLNWRILFALQLECGVDWRMYLTRGHVLSIQTTDRWFRLVLDLHSSLAKVRQGGSCGRLLGHLDDFFLLRLLIIVLETSLGLRVLAVRCLIV